MFHTAIFAKTGSLQTYPYKLLYLNSCRPRVCVRLYDCLKPLGIRIFDDMPLPLGIAGKTIIPPQR